MVGLWLIKGWQSEDSWAEVASNIPELEVHAKSIGLSLLSFQQWVHLGSPFCNATDTQGSP